MLVKERMKRDRSPRRRMIVSATRSSSFARRNPHLPVLDGKKLVGIVTDRDLRQSAPSPGHHPGGPELNYLLERLTSRPS